VASAIALLSLGMLVASLVAIPWLICRLPDDYLNPSKPGERHGPMRRVLRNGLGILLLMLGALMLVLPGQGLLTILVGLTLLDFPRKRRLLLRLLTRRRVLRVMNSIRVRFHKRPLRVWRG